MKIAPWLISDVILVVAIVGAMAFFHARSDSGETVKLQMLQQQLEKARKADEESRRAEAEVLRRRDGERTVQAKNLQDESEKRRGVPSQDGLQTIPQCATLLPKGGTYAISLMGTINTGGASPALSAQFKVADKSKPGTQVEGAAFGRCVALLMR